MLLRQPSTGPLAKLEVWTSLLLEITKVVAATSVVGTIPGGASVVLSLVTGATSVGGKQYVGD